MKQRVSLDQRKGITILHKSDEGPITAVFKDATHFHVVFNESTTLTFTPEKFLEMTVTLATVATVLGKDKQSNEQKH